MRVNLLLVSVKQLSLPSTSSEAEQVADHQSQASPNCLHGQQLLPTQPQAQELPGQDAARVQIAISCSSGTSSCDG